MDEKVSRTIQEISMNIQELSFGQRIDPENGLVECWFTHGALDWIKTQDWSEKNVLMYGAGLGDSWLGKRCKSLAVIERRGEWCKGEDVEYIVRPCDDCCGQDEYYCEIPNDKRFDVIIVDDAYRYECIVKAVEYKPEVLIVDNYMQDYVFICPSAETLLTPYKREIFSQPDHKHHEGNEWKTAIFFIK